MGGRGPAPRRGRCGEARAAARWLWGVSPKTPAAEAPCSHKKLRASPFETAESADCFYKDLEAKRLQAEEDEKDSPLPPPSLLCPP